MNIKVKRENLLQALSINIKILSSKVSIPILNNVLISVDKNKLVLKSTNLEQSIITYVGIESLSEGKCTVNLRNIYEIISNLNSDIIELSLVDNILYISDIKNNINLNTIPYDEFPNILDRSKKDDYFLKISPYDLSFAIDKVSFSTSKDISKEILTGVLLEIRPNLIKFVGINGFRFASIVLDSTDLDIKSKSKIVISRDALDNISDIIKNLDLKKDSYIYIYKIDGNQLLFEIQNVKFETRVLEGKYPKYKKIFPESYSTSFEIGKDDLRNIMKLTSPFKFKEISKISIHVDPQKNKVYFRSSLQEVGEANSSVSTKIEGKELNVSLNANYITDFLNHIDGEKLLIELNSSDSRKVSKITDKNLENFIYLIMPLYER